MGRWQDGSFETYRCSISANTKVLIIWVSKQVLFNANSATVYHGENMLIFNHQWDDDEVRFVLNQQAELDFYSASPLKQQSTDVTPVGHIILIPSQPVFALSPSCCVLSGEATNTNFIVFGLTLPGLESTSCHTRGEQANHYATDAVILIICF